MKKKITKAKTTGGILKVQSIGLGKGAKAFEKAMMKRLAHEVLKISGKAKKAKS